MSLVETSTVPGVAKECGVIRCSSGGVPARGGGRPEPGQGVMADSFSSKLQLWDGWTKSAGEGLSLVSTSPPWPLTPTGIEHPDHLLAREAMGPPAASAADGVEPFSLQWFLDIEHMRHQRYARW